MVFVAASCKGGFNDTMSVLIDWNFKTGPPVFPSIVDINPIEINS